MLIVGLPSFTALYIVTSPAAIFVVAPAAPIDVSPAKVVISGIDASTFKVGIGPVKLVPLRPVPATIEVRSPATDVLLLILPDESTTKTLVSVVVDKSSK